MKSYKEIREYFLSNLEQILTLKKEYEEVINKYPILNDNEEFLKWRFCESSVYEYQGYIEIKSNLVKKFKHKRIKPVIYIENKPHVQIQLYKDKESNINLYKLSVGSLYSKFSLSIPEINLDFLDNLNEFKKGKYSKIFEKKLKTNDDWYGNYVINNKEYVNCAIFLNEYNIKIWTICLSGNDDFSLSKDFLSEKKMLKEKEFLLKNRIINKSDLKDYYFSN